MINWQTIRERIRRGDPRVAATWVGAVIVLACAVWLHMRGGPGPLIPHVRQSAADVTDASEDLAWFDQRLETERAAGASEDPLRACRVASLHWDRAERLSQEAYYRSCGSNWEDDHQEEYTVFRSARLRRDESGDVAAAMSAARQALRLAPQGPARVRALCLLTVACAAMGRWNEDLGGLIELTRYKPSRSWVWHQIARAYRGRGDLARLELAEEQAWRASTDRAMSPFITRVITGTPYARPAPRPRL